jgi:transketolase
MSAPSHNDLANAIRALAMDAVEKAKSGHPGMPMGTADIATVLFTRFLKIDPAHPHWPDRDRFVLSAGHGSMLIYALHHLVGYADMTMEEIKNFRQLGSKTPGHPEYGHTLGVETTTGPLGQGISNAVGMALAERILNADFGDELVDHYTYVICSDGDLMEGMSHEAISIAGHMKLNKLIVMFDDNGISIDGPLSIAESGDQVKRFEAAGWDAVRIDGHDPEAIAAAISAAQKSDKPSLIACKTTIGFGSPAKAGKSSSHGSPLGAEEILATKAALGWTAEPFTIPDDILKVWREAGRRSLPARDAWEKRLGVSDKREEFARRLSGAAPKAMSEALVALKAKAVAEKPEVATRKASETALEVIAPVMPELVSGSADLTGSNNTKTKTMKVVSPGSYSGQFVHWGVREHGMAAAMNGMALHGGVVPASGTFLVFSDYCRPAVRLSSLMNQRVVYVFTHDSIGVGEDGPTHQPVEHMAALRAIPGLVNFRPADQVETAEAWQFALETANRPTTMALTRQNLPTVRLTHEVKNRSAEGAYELRAASSEAKVSLFASGSEVALALTAKDMLEAKGIPTRVVSVPALDLFLERTHAERDEVIGTAKVKIAIEAGIRMGWDEVIGADGHFVGMAGFGASGPAGALFKHFRITPERVVELAERAVR